MEVILHVGAHRTGSTTFQDCLRRNAPALTRAGIGFWGPRRTRTGLFAGATPLPGDPHPQKTYRRARGRVQLRLQQAAAAGLRQVVISDENMIGSVRANARARALYPGIGQRMARFAGLFDGHVTRVVLNIRAQDIYWASALAYGVGRGHPVPDANALRAIADNPRTWRDVITDLACAVPGAQVQVLPFERFVGRPSEMLGAGLGGPVPLDVTAGWLNRSPDSGALRTVLEERGESPRLINTDDGRWQPFDDAHVAALREAYADDMHWLIAGADGVATLTEDSGPNRAGAGLPGGSIARGQGHDGQKGRVAHPG